MALIPNAWCPNCQIGGPVNPTNLATGVVWKRTGRTNSLNLAIVTQKNCKNLVADRKRLCEAPDVSTACTQIFFKELLCAERRFDMTSERRESDTN